MRIVPLHMSSYYLYLACWNRSVNTWAVLYYWRGVQRRVSELTMTSPTCPPLPAIPLSTVVYILPDPASPTVNIVSMRDTVEEDQRMKQQLQGESNPWPTVPVSHRSPGKGSTRVKPRGIVAPRVAKTRVADDDVTRTKSLQ